jgi:hypothetical protein
MENEVWKDVAIEGLGEIYQVSNYGRVKTKERKVLQPHSVTQKMTTYHYKEKILSTNVWDGYVRVGLGNNHYKVHRLVLMTFGSLPINDKMQVNHKDGNKVNNHISNLEWVTNQENVIHAYQNNLIILPKGKDHYKSIRVGKFSIDGNLLETFDCSTQIKEKYGYNIKNIQSVAKGRRKTAHNYIWKYI